MTEETEQLKKTPQGNAVAAVILGGVGFFFWIPSSWIGISFAVLALALGIYSLKRKEANKVSAIIGIVLGSIGIFVSGLALIVGAVFSPVTSITTPSEISPSTSETPEPEATPDGIGTPVVDGVFTFTVNDMECGITTVGKEYLNITPQGQYCRFSITVTNTGNGPNHMFAANQKAFDGSGREFAEDSKPGMYDGSGNIWMTEINPGNSVTGNIYFDIPADAVLTRLELHDSAFSSGVFVSLK